MHSSKAFAWVSAVAGCFVRPVSLTSWSGVDDCPCCFLKSPALEALPPHLKHCPQVPGTGVVDSACCLPFFASPLSSCDLKDFKCDDLDSLKIDSNGSSTQLKSNQLNQFDLGLTHNGHFTMPQSVPQLRAQCFFISHHR